MALTEEDHFDIEKYTKTMNEHSLIRIPEYDWCVKLTENFIVNVEKGKEVNLFHRLMQRLCFGFRWEKIK